MSVWELGMTVVPVELVLALSVTVAWAIRELVLLWIDHRSVKQLEKALLQKRETQ